MTTILAADASTSSALVTFWTAADAQADIDCSGMTAADAVAMLLEQAGDDGARAAILAGSFEAAMSPAIGTWVSVAAGADSDFGRVEGPSSNGRVAQGWVGIVGGPS